MSGPIVSPEEVRDALRFTVCAVAAYDGQVSEPVRRVSSACLAISRTDGVSDVSLARCVQMTSALELADSVGAKTVLLLDADMDISPRQAAALVKTSEDLGYPVSAIYCDAAGRPCLAITGQTLMAGLGAMAVPVECLRMVGHNVIHFQHNSDTYLAFALSGPAEVDDGKGGVTVRWLGEDYNFCLALDKYARPVKVVRIVVGHFKVRSILPSTQSVESVASVARDASVLAPISTG